VNLPGNGISERSLQEYLKVLKDLGAPIKWPRLDRSYYYSVEGQFFINFSSGQPELKKPPHRNEAAL
jgi:hypothetical protein